MGLNKISRQGVSTADSNATPVVEHPPTMRSPLRTSRPADQKQLNRVTHGRSASPVCELVGPVTISLHKDGSYKIVGADDSSKACEVKTAPEDQVEITMDAETKETLVFVKEREHKAEVIPKLMRAVMPTLRKLFRAE